MFRLRRRDRTCEQPSIVALPVPRPYGSRNVTKTAIEESLPDAVGAFLHWLFRESGWTVTERSRVTGEPERIDIRPRHVCLLFRRFTSFDEDMTRPYVQALEARDIPHLLVGGKSFHDREEVETVRAALTAIEWPDDELSVFATLRGALFAIGDDLLLEYRHHFRRFHPVSGARASDRAAAAGGRRADALAHAASAAQPPSGRRHVERPARARHVAHVGFALRPGGEQALANVLHIADLARRYEAEGGLSFRGFVEALERGGAAVRGARSADPRRRQRRRAADDRAQGQGARVSGGRAGRHHAASCRGTRPTLPRSAIGTCARCGSPAGRRRSCWITSRWRSIATSTKGIGSPTWRRRARATCWSCPPSATGRSPTAGSSPLNAAIYPPFDKRRSAQTPPAVRPSSATACSSGRTAIRRAPTPCTRARIAFESGDRAYDVVWWDPGVLNLGDRAPMGVRHEGADRQGRPANYSRGYDSGVSHLGEQLAPMPSSVGRARASSCRRRPTGRGATRTTPAGHRDGCAWTFTPSRATIARGHPAHDLGALVHAVLGTVALDADRPRIEQVVTVHARLLGRVGRGVCRGGRSGRANAGTCAARARACRSGARAVPSRGAADLHRRERDARRGRRGSGVRRETGSGSSWT